MNPIRLTSPTIVVRSIVAVAGYCFIIQRGTAVLSVPVMPFAIRSPVLYSVFALPATFRKRPPNSSNSALIEPAFNRDA
ncbi:hypothetical protein PDM92_21510, partial [Bacillus cereus]|nr:hypothetical protein [Bacillus cereus]